MGKRKKQAVPEAKLQMIIYATAEQRMRLKSAALNSGETVSAFVVKAAMNAVEKFEKKFGK